MINKNKSLLRTFVRVFALILVLSMMLVGCEEEPPKRTFPDYNNSNNSNNSSKDTIKLVRVRVKEIENSTPDEAKLNDILNNKEKTK